MSKVVKLEDQVYEDLDQLRSKGDTFSGVIKRLLVMQQLVQRFKPYILQDIAGQNNQAPAEEG